MILIGVVAQGGATVPGAVTNLTGEQTDNNIGGLNWNAPVSDGGSAITGYRIVSSGMPSDPAYPLIDTTTTSTGIGISQEHGVNYTYTVYAINAVGQGAGTNISLTFGIF